MMTLGAMGSSSNRVFEISPHHILIFWGMQLCQKMCFPWHRFVEFYATNPCQAIDHELFELPFNLSLLHSFFLSISLCLPLSLSSICFFPSFLPSAYN